LSDPTALVNIGSLVTNDPTIGDGPLGVIPDAAVLMADGVVTWVGRSSEAPDVADTIDLDGRCALPGFVDSHAHLMFAGDRADEFAARMNGERYAAGGIRRTVAATRAASDAQLMANLDRLAAELQRSGVTTFETKSGYGLTTDDEARALRIAATVTTETTFLGGHLVPAEFEGRPDAYIDLVCTTMLDACAPHAKWIDVFCDRGAFDVDQARTILTAGMARGLEPRVHVNQLQHDAGVRLAVELNAASADHCTHLDDTDIEMLAGSTTVATLLPGAEFSTRSTYPQARRLIDAGATVALATDCNPGSSYTTSMPLVIALAVREMHMTPDEAVWSATAGGAKALRRRDIGRISVGSRADIISLNAPSHIHLAYRPGVDLIDRVWHSPLTSKVKS
jgi:imidazolonepropionase